MIWFEDMLTGQRWDVSHPDLILRLRNSDRYKEIEDPTMPRQPKKKEKKT